MIAVMISSANHCYYCLVARRRGPRIVGRSGARRAVVMNYRAALSKRQRAMLDFAVKLPPSRGPSRSPTTEACAAPRFSDRDIWDIAAVAGFFNVSNRVASATDVRPNTVYHGQAR